MIALLICMGSIAAFAQLLNAYCRSILSSTRRIEISDRVREVAGFSTDQIGCGDFGRLLQLVQLCPERGDDHGEIRAVGVYYVMLRALQRAASSLVPQIAVWATHECERCSYFAAVALDRRISHSRELFLQQMGSRA